MTTTIQPISADDFARRQAALVPNRWASETAKQQGGLVYALLKMGGTDLSFEIGAASYALGSTRIQTATAPELDLASKDFLGNYLPRNPGETDVSYRQRILDQLLPTGATRPAIVAALTKVTGTAPRVIEPWSAPDTGYWDVASYWDVDTQANPARWGDATLRYQAFIITPGPTMQVLGGNPLETLDDSAYWDVPGYGLINITGNPIQNLYNLLNRMKVEGTIIWVSIQPPPINPTGGLLNDNGVLQLLAPYAYPLSPIGLAPGAVWNNGLTVAVVPGVTPNPTAQPLYYGQVTAVQLLTTGGGNLPLTPPATGSLQLWNNGGEVAVA